MCLTSKEEIKKMFKDLPEVPMLMTLVEPDKHYGMHEFKVDKGRMLSWQILDDKNATIFHTNFSPHTELGWHNHGNSYERVICLEGSIEIEFKDGTKTILNSHDELRIDNKVPHRAKTFGERTWILAITIPKENE